jgi:Tfp pilus assembly protein PilF
MKSIFSLRKSRMRPTPCLIITLILLWASAPLAFAQPVDQVPMYGGADRSIHPILRAADEKLIEDTTRHYGSRLKASAAFVENGFAYYARDDLANAMRRFNQAWLLDSNNPEVYFGFGAVLHDKGMNCAASAQFDKAASFGRYVQGLTPDAARLLVLCAQEDKSLTEGARAALFARSDALYAEALAKEPNKGYVHASMATAMYWRGSYPEAWAAVARARAFGGKLSERFLQALSQKMAEPK